VPGPNLFKDINRIFPRPRSAKTSCLTNPDGSKATNPTEMRAFFRDFFADLYKARQAPHLLPSPPQTHLSCFYNVHAHTRMLISELPNKRSSGPDHISLIKKLNCKIIRRVSSIFDVCLKLCYFPVAWKTANIIVLPKTTKPLSPSNFRPISLVDCFGKILEKLICPTSRSKRQRFSRTTKWVSKLVTLLSMVSKSLGTTSLPL
jgi:hypothetical protein